MELTMDGQTTQLEVIVGVLANDFVAVACKVCGKGFYWLKGNVLPNFCPYCGRRNTTTLPPKA